MYKKHADGEFMYDVIWMKKSINTQYDYKTMSKK